MKKIITHIISFTAILLFLASSTGISFVIHYCHSAQTEHIQLFADTYKCKTEIEKANQKPSCCCAMQIASSVNKNLIHLDKSDCCKNTYKFIKFSYQYDNGPSTLKHLTAQCTVIPNCIALLNDNNPIPKVLHLYHPPPRPMFGKYLIHFIQRIKIPSPSYC